jgi:hypothetical protein
MGGLKTFAQCLKVLGEETCGCGMKGKIARLAALTMYSEMEHSPACREVPHLQQAQLFPTKPMIEKGGEDRPITFALQTPIIRRI